MEHPDLTWRIHQSILQDKQRRAAIHNDTGIAYVTRKALGSALIALGTRLTPASLDAPRQAPVAPGLVSRVRSLPAAPSLK